MLIRLAIGASLLIYRWRPMTSPLARAVFSLSCSVEFSEARRAVHGISHLYTPITHTLYSLIKRQTHFSVVHRSQRYLCVFSGVFLLKYTFSAAAASLRRICGVHSDLSECVFVCVIVSSEK